jgi:hypothetical protein
VKTAITSPGTLTWSTEVERLLGELLAAFTRFEAKVDALQATVDRMAANPRSTLSRADRRTLAKLLPAAGGVFGSEPFATRELFERDAPALRIVMRGLERLKVGRLLLRAVGHDIDGYLVERVGDELHRALWRIVQVDGFSSGQNLTVAPRSAATGPHSRA